MTEHFPPTTLTVPRRFRGPDSSGNGGWSSGALAALACEDHPDRCREWPSVEVTLRQPPPLDVPLHVDHLAADDPGNTGRDELPLTVLTIGGARVAEAQVVPEEVAPVEPVTADDARAARSSYPGLRSHPFPHCFTCGTERDEADGLRIFPGRVADAADGSTRVASTWTPHPSTHEDWHEYVDDVPRAGLPVTWAALDCTGGWAGDLEERLMVLGRMTAEIDALPAIGEEHVVVGQHLGSEGRRTYTASTLYDSDGRCVGRARHVWVAIDPATFGR